jgi:hypothetical protein
MAGPSKEERKRLRRQLEESARQTDVFSHVVSLAATREKFPPETIVAEAERVGVVLSCRRTGESVVFGVPDGPPALAVVLGYGVVDDDLVRTIERYEWAVEGRAPFALGMPVISFRAKIELDPTIHFLNAAVTRVLGRLTKGVLASSVNEVVMDEWIFWTYGTPGVPADEIATRYPQLRKSPDQPRGNPPHQVSLVQPSPPPLPRRPWWRVW